ncbi:DUF2804 domain-containing protein [Limnobacter sp.]|uniref:DUF2804 domain-containing protein n=1 Tax=Limnobacter sp. TaxID=2003368 RepID=UPI003515B83E
MNLIDLQGRPVWGRLPQLPANINWRNFDARNAMGKRRPAWQKSLLFKHFDFYSVASPGFTFGCGMVRLGLVNSTFAYLYTPLGGLHHQQFDLPGDWGLHIDTRPLGQTGWVHPFKTNHWVRSTREAESRNLVFQFGEHFSADVTLRCEPAHVLALNTPIANTGFAYAQKTSGCPVEGQIRLGDEVHAVQAGRDGCYHDWTAGFLRRETFWNWACATGVNAQGERVSVNVARGVNETSAHENVVWVDGAMHTLPLVLFDYDRDDVSQPWRVYSQCAAVDLKFTPVGSVHDHRNLWVLASRFNQCFGVFSGQVMLPDGRAVLVDGLHGWCEDHYAKW